MRKLKIFICILSILLFSLPTFAKDPVAQNFEEIYQGILNNKEFANLGNPEGQYVIIEFFDYRCSHCKRNRFKISELIQSGQLPNVRWISIETPIFDKQYNDMAYLIYAAKKQNKYNELFAKAPTLKNPTINDIEKFAKELELDLTQLWKDATEASKSDVFESNIKLFSLFNFSAVPLMILDKKIYYGGLSEKAIQRVIKDSNNKSK